MPQTIIAGVPPKKAEKNQYSRKYTVQTASRSTQRTLFVCRTLRILYAGTLPIFAMCVFIQHFQYFVLDVANLRLYIIEKQFILTSY